MEGIEGERGSSDHAADIPSPENLIANEKKILAAYDRSIAPISWNHEKFGFLVAQHDWLKHVVDELSEAVTSES